MTSAEQGTLVILICVFNAAGVFVTPMYIFPRKRMVDSTLMKDAPPGAGGYASPKGWTHSDLFVM